ncbi:YqhG/Tai3 family protein [Dickeya oryzae]
MNKLLPLVLLFSAAAYAAGTPAPKHADTDALKAELTAPAPSPAAEEEEEDVDTAGAKKQAIAFYKWYIGQIAQNKLPIQDNDPTLEKYVVRNTVKALRTSKISTDVDFFLRSNGLDEDDWLPNVRVVGTDVDPICVNLYMVLGKTSPKRLVTCYVQENGAWKLRSVTDLDEMFTKNNG